MAEYRIDKAGLWTILEGWDAYLPRKVRLIACGGTALTIQDLKPSTKDVDFLVPEDSEHVTLVQTIRRLGYRQATGSGWTRGDGYIFDLFAGKTVFVTELLESPLEQGNHIPIKAFKKLSVAALNDYDLVISKMFRGSAVDIQDCLALIRARSKDFDRNRLEARYKETAQYDLNPERVLRNLENLLYLLKE
jgi:hypothetical protein